MPQVLTDDVLLGNFHLLILRSGSEVPGGRHRAKATVCGGGRIFPDGQHRNYLVLFTKRLVNAEKFRSKIAVIFETLYLDRMRFD
jgi:hypothetical protein